MGHFDGLEPEGLGQVLLAGLVAVREDRRATPACRNNGNTIAGPESPRLDERPPPPLIGHIASCATGTAPLSQIHCPKKTAPLVRRRSIVRWKPELRSPCLRRASRERLPSWAFRRSWPRW